MTARKKAPRLSEVALKTKRATTENPLVFISHDSRDADLAEAVHFLVS